MTAIEVTFIKDDGAEISIELDNSAQIEQVIQMLVVRNFIPSQDYTLYLKSPRPDDVGEHLDSIASGSKPHHKLIFDRNSKRLLVIHELPYDQTLAAIGITADDQILVKSPLEETLEFTPQEAQRFGGWPDYLTIAASIASITQVLLMVADMWARKSKEKNVTKTKVVSGEWNEVKEIQVLMTDGNRVQFNSWLTDPGRLKEFLKVFRSSSVTPQPVSMTFILDNGSKVQMNISGSQNDDHWLEIFIKQLKFKDNQKD